MKAKCTQTTKAKLIVFSEKRSTLTVVNSDLTNTTRIIVDGCEITTGIRCDYLMIAKNVEHYIELKGQDIEHAMDQIIATINALSSNVSKQAKVSFIVCTRSPLASAKIQNIQLKFKKQFNSALIVKSSPAEYKL